MKELNADQEQALDKLRNPKLGGISLTGWGVQRLRDKKTKKVLGPHLERVLPRRMRGIEFSSYYRALRVRLLPDNPFFLSDVVQLRQIFGIPSSGLPADLVPEWKGLHKLTGDISNIKEWHAATSWYALHSSAARGVEPEESDPPPLPGALLSMAQKVIDPAATPLKWLATRPTVPKDFARYFDLSVPMDYCIARLIERYRLPWTVGLNLRLFLLIGNPKYLKSAPTADVIVAPTVSEIGAAFRVTVDRVDEYTTRKQWAAIYDEWVKPALDSLWEARGELPYSKQVEVNTLTQGWLLELLRLTKDPGKLSLTAALELVSQRSDAPSSGIDRSVAQQALKRLNSLMSPADSA